MTEPENFLERWSRRKRSAAGAAVPEKDEIAPQTEKENDAPAAAPAAAADESKGVPESEPFDLASLPSIESIGANTDIRAFLLPGVPPELTRAALRRAWSADPAIRDFVGLVENGWDFNDPNGIPGFGSIGAADVARLLSHMIGDAPAEAAAPPAEPPKVAALDGEQERGAPPVIESEPPAQLQQDPPAVKQDAAAPVSLDVQRSVEDGASQNKSGN
jgi:hypothetical protein